MITVICATSVVGDEPRRMLNVIQRFGKHPSCHLQGECLLVGCFWKPYIEQVISGEWRSGGAACYSISDEHVVEERR
jgi:hypothetical protein